MPIDEKKWGSDQFVKLVAGRPKTLTLVSYQDTETQVFDKATNTMKTIPCVKFVVDNEDGEKVSKEWSVTARKLANNLNPLIEQTLDKGQPLKITVTQFGTGFATEYEVKKV